ncbi:MAG: hypothetical protein IJD95_06505 [Clostridia bacterium]|nr:hypothetical protein [Clostridia bacterium]MBR2327340.1 hypothetical protein [Clostridia bacterium]
MVNSHKFAGLTVNYEAKCELLKRRSEKFITEYTDKPDISIDIPFGFFEKKQRENPNLTIDECEYLWLGGEFYKQLIDFDGFLLHSSTVVMDGEAYMFSAAPGTGKSTHAALWLKLFGKRAHVLNDDKPCLRLTDGEFFACGTPFSGKSDLSENETVRAKAICFLERGEENSIRRLESKEVILRFLNQTHRPASPELMEKLLSLLNELCKKVPFYLLHCNMDISAAKLSHEVMSAGN